MPFSPRINALEAIRNYRARSVVAEGSRPAAVLVLIQETQLEHYVTLIERAATLCLHSGEIAFPGGSVAAEDKDALAAALRESQEEIGIDPENVQIIGQLDQVTIGVVLSPYDVRPNEEEVRCVVSVPVSALLVPDCFSAELYEADSRPRIIYHFRYKTLDIWGATARILKQLLELAYGFQPDMMRQRSEGKNQGNE